MSGKIIPGRRKFSIPNDDYVMYKNLVTDIIFQVPRFAGFSGGTHFRKQNRPDMEAHKPTQHRL